MAKERDISLVKKISERTEQHRQCGEREYPDITRTIARCIFAGARVRRLIKPEPINTCIAFRLCGLRPQRLSARSEEHHFVIDSRPTPRSLRLLVEIILRRLDCLRLPKVRNAHDAGLMSAWNGLRF